MYYSAFPVSLGNPHFSEEAVLEVARRTGVKRITLSLGRELDYAFSSPEVLERLRKAIPFFELHGYEVMVWLGESVGHSTAPATAVGPYTPLRQLEQGDMEAFCPADERFLADCAHWVQQVARCGAKMILWDDDVRLLSRGGIGCCCEQHMAAFCHEVGETVTREQLREKVFSGGRNRYRDAWLKVQGDTLRRFADRMRAALDEVAPQTRMGFCVFRDSWDADGTDVPDLCRRFAGNTRPFVRTLGAAFLPYLTGNVAFSLGEVAEWERTQARWLKGQGIEVFTEGDTFPRPRFYAPASYVEALDTIQRADGNFDGSQKHILDNLSPVEYETGYIRAMERNRERYAELETLFGDKACVGVTPITPMHSLADRELDGNDPQLAKQLEEAVYFIANRFAVLTSLPTTDDAAGISLVFGEAARYLPADRLNNGTVLDLPAAMWLMQNGVDVGLSSVSEPCAIPPESSEYFPERGWHTRVDGGILDREIELKPGAEVLSLLCADQRRPGLIRYENAAGQRFLLFPYAMEKTRTLRGYLENYLLRETVVNTLDWLGKRAFPAISVGRFPRLFNLVKAGNGALAVGLWNLYEDAAEGVRIRIGDAYAHVRFVGCTGHRDGNDVVLDTAIAPYAFAGVELTE